MLRVCLTVCHSVSWGYVNNILGTLFVIHLVIRRGYCSVLSISSGFLRTSVHRQAEMDTHVFCLCGMNCFWCFHFPFEYRGSFWPTCIGSRIIKGKEWNHQNFITWRNSILFFSSYASWWEVAELRPKSRQSVSCLTLPSMSSHGTVRIMVD